MADTPNTTDARCFHNRFTTRFVFTPLSTSTAPTPITATRQTICSDCGMLLGSIFVTDGEGVVCWSMP